MPNLNKTTYTFGAAFLLLIMLVGSPLASFGCRTIVPDQFQVPCEKTLGNTAVQNNFIQPIIASITVLVALNVICWLKPKCHCPQELFLLPPLPPPRKTSTSQPKPYLLTTIFK